MIEVARRNAPSEVITHQVYEVAGTRKRALLAHLIRTREMKQVLVFVRMKRDANKLARELEQHADIATLKSLYQSAAISRRAFVSRLAALATTNTGNEMANTPADSVKTLYGIGVRPAMPTAHTSYLRYRAWTSA